MSTKSVLDVKTEGEAREGMMQLKPSLLSLKLESRAFKPSGTFNKND